MEETEDVNAAIESVVQLKRRERDPCNAMEPPTMFVSQENDWLEPVSSSRSPEVFTETLEGQILTSCLGSDTGLEHPAACAFIDSDMIVEELTLKNYKRLYSNSQEEMSMGKGQWQSQNQLAFAPWNKNLHGDIVSKEPGMVGGAQHVENMFLPGFSVQQPLSTKNGGDDHCQDTELYNNGEDTKLGNMLIGFPGGIQTKDPPASGFTEIFVKNTLKGKDLVHRHLGTPEGLGIRKQGQKNQRAICDAGLTSIASQPSSARAEDLSACSRAGANVFHHGISLRERLKPGYHEMTKAESLCVFKRIVELVDHAHSQGIALKDIRPSKIIILPLNRIKSIGSWGPQVETELSESVINDDSYCKHHLKRKIGLEQGMHSHNILWAKHQKLNEHVRCGQYNRPSVAYGKKYEKLMEDDVKRFRSQYSGCDLREVQHSEKGHWTRNMSSSPNVQLTVESLLSEERWYSSPEELNDGICTLSSNIYSLGVLLFEVRRKLYHALSLQGIDIDGHSV